MLIAFRAVMGIGGAAVLPVSLAIITVVFPREERGKAIGMWAGASEVRSRWGRSSGGMLLQHPEWSEWLTGNAWGSVFLINVPIIADGDRRNRPRCARDAEPQPAAARRQRSRRVCLSACSRLIFGIIHASEAGTWIDPSGAGADRCRVLASSRSSW